MNSVLTYPLLFYLVGSTLSVADEMGFRVDYELQAPLARLAADYQERLKELRRLEETVLRLTATARARDGSVAVEVGPQGQLLALWLDPRACREMSPQRLSQAIVRLAGDAAADAMRQVREIMAPALPAGLPEDSDFTALMPNAPSLLGHDLSGGTR
jgi:DNA-binding protein YbaB